MEEFGHRYFCGYEDIPFTLFFRNKFCENKAYYILQRKWVFLYRLCRIYILYRFWFRCKYVYFECVSKMPYIYAVSQKICNVSIIIWLCIENRIYNSSIDISPMGDRFFRVVACIENGIYTNDKWVAWYDFVFGTFIF